MFCDGLDGWLVVNPIKVNNFAYLFDCTTVGQPQSEWGYHPKPNLSVHGDMVTDTLPGLS